MEAKIQPEQNSRLLLAIVFEFADALHEAFRFERSIEAATVERVTLACSNRSRSPSWRSHLHKGQNP
jgi:hypothetical protein